MLSEPTWLPFEEVVETNRDVVADTGEPHAVLDAGALDGACARARLAWEYGTSNLADLAVKLLFGIAVNHPFEQGNKRTGWLSALMFLRLNGVETSAADEIVGELIVAVLEHRISEDYFTEWFRSTMDPLS